MSWAPDIALAWVLFMSFWAFWMVKSVAVRSVGLCCATVIMLAVWLVNCGVLQ